MGAARLGETLRSDGPPGTRWGRLVDMGNPHVVLYGAAVDGDTVRSVGERLGRSVPGGANVEFVWPGPGPDELVLRVWERGVGETLACGTGTCAAVAAAHDHGDTGRRVRVHNPGGSLDVELTPHGIALAGPTQRVGEVVVDEAVLAALVAALDVEASTAPAVPGAAEVASTP
jgi:diaminopimelate epimerase